MAQTAPSVPHSPIRLQQDTPTAAKRPNAPSKHAAATLMPTLMLRKGMVLPRSKTCFEMAMVPTVATASPRAPKSRLRGGLELPPQAESSAESTTHASGIRGLVPFDRVDSFGQQEW
jgi:hypothetical protein